MKENMEEIILKEIFKLSDKIDKMVTKEEFKKELERFVTKEDLKKELERFATKEDLKREIAKCATKEELKEAFEKCATKEELKKGFEEQAEEIATIIRNTFKTSTKIHNELELRVANNTDKKIKSLKSQLACMKGTK